VATIQEILSLGKGGLNASKSLLALTSQNVANVGTIGYTRQRMNLYNAPVLGLGVVTGNPEAVRNSFVLRGLMSSFGSKGYADGQIAALKLAEPALNDVDGAGLSFAMSNFLDALGQVSANPSAAAERTQLVQAANGLASQFKLTAQSLADAASGTVNQIKDYASKVSTKTADIAELNAQIKGLIATGQNANSLIDKRDLIVAELSEIVGVQVIQESDSTVSVFTAGGRPLVEGLQASSIEVSDPAPDGTFTVKVVKANGQKLDPLQDFGGKLGGAISAYQNEIKPAVDTLDEMAFTFVNAFNTQHQAGFDLAGNAGGDFFNPIAAQQGAAFNISLSGAVADNPSLIAAAGAPGDVPGGNDNLLLLMQIQEQPGLMASGASITSAWSQTAQSLGSAIQNANVASITEGGTLQQLIALQQEESGVSLDEEMINMSIAQKSLEAASAVIRAADDMYDTILSLVR
jgi:flagellar hook-associated protein 1 FlgK